MPRVPGGFSREGAYRPPLQEHPFRGSSHPVSSNFAGRSSFRAARELPSARSISFRASREAPKLIEVGLVKRLMTKAATSGIIKYSFWALWVWTVFDTFTKFSWYGQMNSLMATSAIGRTVILLYCSLPLTLPFIIKPIFSAAWDLSRDGYHKFMDYLHPFRVEHPFSTALLYSASGRKGDMPGLPANVATTFEQMHGFAASEPSPAARELYRLSEAAAGETAAEAAGRASKGIDTVHQGVREVHDEVRALAAAVRELKRPGPSGGGGEGPAERPPADGGNPAGGPKADRDKGGGGPKGGPKPPAADAKPPVADAKPPVADAKPPAVDAKPPAVDAKPPVADAKPPAADEETLETKLTRLTEKRLKPDHKAVICVEDRGSETLLNAIIASHPDGVGLLSQLCLFASGSVESAEAMVKEVPGKTEGRKAMAVLGGDRSAPAGGLVLPGGKPATTVVFEALKAANWAGLAERFQGADPAQFVAACEETWSESEDRTTFAARLAARYKIPNKKALRDFAIWNACCEEYAKTHLAAADRDAIVSALQSLITP